MRSVRWIIPDTLLITSCASSDTIIWKLDTVTNILEPLHVLDDGSRTSLIVSDGILANDNVVDTLTSANDFFLRFWTNETFRCKVLLNNYAFDIKIIKNSNKFWLEETLTVIYASADCKVVLGQLNQDHCFTELFKFSGHSDWVRSVDYMFSKEDTLFIASAAQDNFIRIWKITESVADKNSTIIEQTFQDSNNQIFVVNMETVLAGHEAAVYCVKFIPTFSSRLSVMSSSLDKSVMVWEEPDGESNEDGIWCEKFRVGEIGGNNMGFLGISYPTNMDSFSNFCAYSYNGSIHVWKLNHEFGAWDADIGMGGHNDVVTDIAWDPTGNYLLSTSNDETTRLRAVWSRGKRNSWHEIARPQIHGYLINCLAVLNELTFVTGADEKVLRVFRGTKNFVKSLRNISGIELNDTGTQLPETAMTPALGLSNRAVFSGTQIAQEGDAMIKLENCDTIKSLNIPPSEELLMQSTLWPEIHKLYGHGHEIYAVAASHDGSLIASCCKATKPDQAGIILWDVSLNFKRTQVLPGHSLTVTSIKFSPDDRMIVSVSRDRTWFLYKRKEESKTFVRVANSDKKSGLHLRIIWDVSWTFDSEFFITVSRDKKIICWNVSDSSSDLTVKPITDSVLTLEEAVMTIDVFGQSIDSKYLVSLGLENGDVLMYTWDRKNWDKITFDNKSLLKRTLGLRKVRFAPTSQSTQKILLATCGEDYMVQIFTITS